ncbi:EamA family transporter [Lysobacter sp. HA35]
MTVQNLLLLLSTVVLLSIGQILFKLAAVSVDVHDLRTLVSIRLISALTIYGVATVMWMAVLSRVPLATAFPFYGLTFLLVPLFSSWWLGEPLRWNSLAGGMIIMAGVAMSVAKWS